MRTQFLTPLALGAEPGPARKGYGLTLSWCRCGSGGDIQRDLTHSIPLVVRSVSDPRITLNGLIRLGGMVNARLWTAVALLVPLAGIFPAFTWILLWLLGVEGADAVSIFNTGLVAAFFLIAWQLKRRLKRQVSDNSTKIPCQVLTLKLSKDLDKTVEVPSQSRPGRVYKVNLYRMACTCPGFKKSRKRQQQDSLHRMCRHLRATALAEIGADLGVLRPILSDWQHGECYIKLGDDVIFSYAPGRNWIYVYAKSGQRGNGQSAYGRFEYNLEREHWYYDNHPMEESRIMGLIRDYF